MRRRSRPALLTGATVVIVLLLGACGARVADPSITSGGDPLRGGTLVDLEAFAAGDPDHIDPALAADTSSAQVASLLYEGLTRSNDKGETVDAVASSVVASPDATRWTFTLRSDARYANGDPVLPSDFRFAWSRVLDPALGSKLAYHFAVIQGADATEKGQPGGISGVVADDVARTLVVTLVRPVRDFAAVVSLPAFSPLPQRLVSALHDQRDWEQGTMVGNGPFVMSGPWQHDRGIELARNDAYVPAPGGHGAYLDRLVLRVSKSVDSAYNDFDAGNGDVARIPPGSYVSVRSQHGSASIVNPSLLGVEYWGFNMADPTVGGPANEKLRQAIALVVDRSDIVGKVYDGQRRVATGWAPPGVPGYEPAVDRGTDVSRARQLMKEWGGQAPSLRISFNAGAGHEEKAQIIQQNLGAIGIHAELDPIDQRAYQQALRQGSLQFFRYAWNADYVSYDDFVAPLFTTTGIGQDNVFGFSDPEVDRLVAAARAEPDDAARAADYRAAEAAVLRQQVVVPLTWASAGLVIDPKVHGLHVSPLGGIDYGEAWLGS